MGTVREAVLEVAGREVVITGQFDHVEIWDAARWERQRDAGDEALAAGRER